MVMCNILKRQLPPPHPFMCMIIIMCMHSYKGKYDFEVPWIALRRGI